MKKILCLILSVLMISLMFMPVYADEDDGGGNLPLPTLSTKMKITNCAHTDRVLNTSTDVIPVTNDAVALWSWSNNSTQWWCVKKNGRRADESFDTYRIVLNSYPSLALNYHQADTTCTIYPFDGNDYRDYRLQFLTGMNGYVVSLYYRGRCLGCNGGSLGSQCYWYISNPTSEENWDIDDI